MRYFHWKCSSYQSITGVWKLHAVFVNTSASLRGQVVKGVEVYWKGVSIHGSMRCPVSPSMSSWNMQHSKSYVLSFIELISRILILGEISEASNAHTTPSDMIEIRGARTTTKVMTTRGSYTITLDDTKSNLCISFLTDGHFVHNIHFVQQSEPADLAKVPESTSRTRPAVETRE